MGFLLALTCAAILYGSLYPFSFNFGLHEEGVLALLMASVHDRISYGDTIANIILYLPFGFFAMQCLLPRVPKPVRLMLVAVVGAAFSLGIECTQSVIPGRVTSVYDLANNMIGALFGAVLGWNDWREKLSRFQRTNRPPALFPFLLLGAWLGDRLFPFVPTLDVQNVKNALKPLFFAGFSPLEALQNFIITMAVCRVVRAVTVPGKVRMVATFLPFAVIAVKPFIEGRVISQAGIVGTLFGIAVWWCISGRIRPATNILALLLVVQIVIQELKPFVFNPTPVSLFSLVPFSGLMAGSEIMGMMWFFEKIFLYGSLVWLLIKAGGSLRFTLIFSAVLLAALELIQMFQPGRVSEITDPLLAVVLGLVLYSLDLRGAAHAVSIEPVKRTRRLG
jgi:VanZ family protein